MPRPNICSCCQDIWNSENLEPVNLGKNKLYLCPGCYKEYTDVVYSAFKAGFKEGKNTDKKSDTINKKINVRTLFKKWNTGIL